jgi:hypothetical protein
MVPQEASEGVPDPIFIDCCMRLSGKSKIMFDALPSQKETTTIPLQGHDRILEAGI